MASWDEVLSQFERAAFRAGLVLERDDEYRDSASTAWNWGCAIESHDPEEFLQAIEAACRAARRQAVSEHGIKH